MKQSPENAHRLSRRQFLAASGGVTAVAMLAACTGAPASAPVEAPSADCPILRRREHHFLGTDRYS